MCINCLNMMSIVRCTLKRLIEFWGLFGVPFCSSYLTNVGANRKFLRFADIFLEFSSYLCRRFSINPLTKT